MESRIDSTEVIRPLTLIGCFQVSKDEENRVIRILPERSQVSAKPLQTIASLLIPSGRICDVPLRRVPRISWSPFRRKAMAFLEPSRNTTWQEVEPVRTFECSRRTALKTMTIHCLAPYLSVKCAYSSWATSELLFRLFIFMMRRISSSMSSPTLAMCSSTSIAAVEDDPRFEHLTSINSDPWEETAVDRFSFRWNIIMSQTVMGRYRIKDISPVR